MKKLLPFALALTLIAVLSVGVAVAQVAQTPEEICAAAEPVEPETREFSEPEQVLEAGVDYRAVFCTEAGAVYIDLFEEFAPVTVNSFVFLAQQGYYDNTTFHRVIQGFMAQGGDPTATGTGGPGYGFQDEFAGFLTFDRSGWLAMANTGQPMSNGSQFFITTAPATHLDFRHTIFGEVLEGEENVRAIELRDPATATEPGTALETVVILTDPATVDTTYEAPAPATEAELQEHLDLIVGQLPEALLIDEETSGILSAEEVAATAPEGLQADFAEFLETHNFDFRAANRVTNAACDLQALPFMAISYSLDRFGSPDDARAALEDGFYGEMATEAGFTENAPEAVPYPVYTQERTVCETAAVDALTHWQRGSFVATVSITYPAEFTAPAETWLSQGVAMSTYERLFSDVLRRELRVE